MGSVYLFILSYFLSISVLGSQNEVIPITIETDIYQSAQKIISEKSALDIHDFTDPLFQRPVVEFILIQQALALGGSEIDFSFTLGNYDARNIMLIQSGMLLINFDSMWLSHIDDLREDVYISDAIIRKGEYWAGVYTAVGNDNALAIKNLADFKKLSVISNKHWLVDWNTLTQLKPKSLIHEEEWLSMAKLVSLQWVDVMLAPFPSKAPFIYQGKDYKIIAVEGVKVGLNDSRHFVISKNHPHGKETYLALQKGLKILRKRGRIAKAFQQSGFFNTQIKTWHAINTDFLKVNPLTKEPFLLDKDN